MENTPSSFPAPENCQKASNYPPKLHFHGKSEMESRWDPSTCARSIWDGTWILPRWIYPHIKAQIIPNSPFYGIKKLLEESE